MKYITEITEVPRAKTTEDRTAGRGNQLEVCLHGNSLPE